MQRYQLRFVYGNLRSAIRRRDWPHAWQSLGQAIGVDMPPCPSEHDLRAAVPLLREQLSYRGAKPAELAMLNGDIKQLVKLEDLPVPEAAQIARSVAHSHRALPSAPYRKDYLLLRSRPAAAADPRALVTLYCSRDDRARELWRMEANQREDPRRAGRLLEIPPCCIDAFAADCERSRRDQDALNDDACRRVLATATADAPGDWRLNPMANAELIGFYPCSARCPAAVERAQAVLAAMPTAAAQAAERQLRRPVLYYRLPFFATFTDRWLGGVLQPDDCAVNAMPDAAARTAQALFAALVAHTLSTRGTLAAGPADSTALLCRWQ
ncbi:MAG: hypothetical protein FJ100_13640 [Deltaproteobacteria bacterium]|nr:hypothetical protein [Deltaproteobacteria bacterium]